MGRPLGAMRVADVSARLGPHHRVALALRYVDGLPGLCTDDQGTEFGLMAATLEPPDTD